MNQEGGEFIKDRCLNRILDIINKVLPNKLKFKTEREKLVNEFSQLLECSIDDARTLMNKTSITDQVIDIPSPIIGGRGTRRHHRRRKRRTRRRRKHRHTRRKRRRRKKGRTRRH